MTQADRIINHLQARGSITSTVAFGLYGISRISAVIYNLRHRGYNIQSVMKMGVNGSPYAEYTLVTDHA